MADSVVSLAVERISNLLIQEAVFLHEVKDEVQRLQAELNRMLCFLRDADRRHEQEERIRNLVAEIRDVAYNSEDVIDMFILQAAQMQGGSCIFLKKLASCCKKPAHLHKIGVEVQSIWRKLKDISDSMRTYDVKFVEEGEGMSAISERQKRNRRTYAHAEEEYVFGLEDSVKAVIDQLMTTEEKLHVVSIVGMGGSGKTALARRVYNSSDVKHHFDCCAWVFVSQQCATTTRDVLLGIQSDVQYLSTVLESTSEEAMVKSLHKFLEKRRYLIVLDDIWQVEAWESIKNAFPNGKMGSKVLLTTRNKDIAFHADPRSSPIEAPLLSDEDSWELLRRKAFPREVVDNSGGCPPECEKLGREMVKGCGGLPLAVSVLGNLLATKMQGNLLATTMLSEWQAVQKDMYAQLKKFEREQKYEGVFGKLALSYYDLPYYLKPCFLYLGHFPEDCAIPRGKLIRLWVAEGFADPISTGLGEETMEDEAELYFQQLVSRFMVQVWESGFEGERGVKTCRLHDLMRHMCVSKAREENFLRILQPRNSTALSYIEMTNSRRIAVHQNSSLQLIQLAVKVRSLLFFLPQAGSCQYDAIGKSKNFRLLRVLDLQGIRFEDDTMGEEIGSLIHLKYLSLRGCLLQNLPQSISDLQRLYTLDLRGNNFSVLPNDTWKLKQLRHLFVDDREKTGFARLGTLTHLHTLKNVSAESIITDDGQFKLRNLRNMGISFKLKRDVGIILESPMERLRSLKMEFTTAAGKKAYKRLKALHKCHSLFKLQLSGVKLNQGQSLGHPLHFLPLNLGKLTLQYVYLEQDPMPVLEKLHALRILNLQSNSYSGCKMVCSANGFPQLKFLKLSGLTRLEEWIVEETSMPSLLTVCIDDLRSLTMIPKGLMFIKTLQELIATGVTSYSSLKSLRYCHSLLKLHLSGVNLNQDWPPGHPLYILPFNLEKLTLQYMYLEQDPMPVLEKLPTLRILNLQRNSYTGRKMVCSANGFPQLTFLKLSGLRGLEEWIVEETSMPRLVTLCIDDLRSLKMIPEGLMFITTLQELIATGLTPSLRSRLQAPQRGNGGEDHYKISHIQSLRLVV